MSVSRSVFQILVLAGLASFGLTEQPIKSIITGYGILSSGYASSSNTLYTGAQGGEHSATFNDPGDCATNIDVYPIGTKIYVVVGANPLPPTCTISTVLENISCQLS